MSNCPIRRIFQPCRIEKIERAAMKNGFKPCVYENDGVYRGEWKNDVKEGIGRMTYYKEKIYEGHWAANKRNGFGVLKKKVGNQYKVICKGQWLNNRFIRGKCYQKYGVYNGNFSTSMSGIRTKCGYGTMRWNDGTVYRGNWYNDNYYGIGRLIEVNGNYYEGQWCHGVKHGEGIYVFKDKNQFMEGVWVEGFPKIGVIRCFGEEDTDTDPTATRRPLIPKMKSDDDLIRKIYEDTKSEMLGELRTCEEIFMVEDETSAVLSDEETETVPS